MWGISEGVFRQATSLRVRRWMTSSVLPYLYDYIKQTRGGFFLLKKKKKQFWNSSEWATFHKGGPSSYFGAAGEWNDSSRINYVWPQTEGSEWTCVDRRPVTSRSWWWKKLVRSFGKHNPTESQRIGGQRLSPPTKKKMLPLCSSVTGQTPWVVFTHARTRTHSHKAFLHEQDGEQPRGFQSSAAHPDWESRSTCNISSQWKCSTSTQRD